jgi:flagellar motor protein MotB
MRRQSFFFLCLFFTFGVHAQNDNSPALLNPADSSVFLYEHSMRYVGSSTHVDMNYQYVLEYLVEVLEKNPTWTVHIRGHVCCGPSERISCKRAKNAYKFLIRLGVDPSRMSYKGYSDTLPLAFPEKTEEDEIINRRVDFVIHR